MLNSIFRPKKSYSKIRLKITSYEYWSKEKAWCEKQCKIDYCCDLLEIYRCVFRVVCIGAENHVHQTGYYPGERSNN